VLRVAAVALALLGLVPVANLLTAGREVPWWRLGVLIWCGYGGLLLALLWIAADRWGDALDRLAARVTSVVMGVPSGPFVAGVSALTTLLGIGVALYCYAGRGFTGDEMAMAWHARMLLAGHLAIPSTAHPEFFNTVSVLERDGRWFSQYPIGGPALLALGQLVGAVWLVNPLLLGVAAWQLYRFTRRAFGEPTARAATLLFALTPFVLVLGATQMNHTAAMAFTLVALAELTAWDDDATPSRLRHAAGLGLAVGAIALVRPLDAALVALPIGLFQLARVGRDPRRLASLAVQCAAGALPVALLLWANARTTGAPFLFGYDAAHGPAHALGFHIDPTGTPHTPRRGLVYASGYLMRFDRFLFEWPLPGLLVVCAVLASLRRATRWDMLLVGLLGSFLTGYAAYWHNGFFDGPRFLFPVAPVLVLYAARAPEAASRVAHATGRRVAQLVVPACVLCAWLVPLAFSSVPGRVLAQHEQRTKLKTDVVAQASVAGLTDALVLVREPWRARLLARLRGLGVPQFDAERVVDTTDACALQVALDEADVAPPADSVARRDHVSARVLARVLARARSAGGGAVQAGAIAESRIARALGGPDSPHCREEDAADSLGTMPYALFLREQEVRSDGRLGGRVVWARDLGRRDTLLRDEFGARRWYRYRPGRSLDDAATFVPVDHR
jgi:4-amino-4-deoxy-L-arabinose transferase-like glycosyltransferase